MTPPREYWWSAIGLKIGLVVFLGAMLRFLPLRYGLPFLYHPDETAIIFNLGKFLWGLKSGYVYMETSMFYYPLAALFGGYFLVGRAAGWFASLAQFEQAFLLNDPVLYLLGRLLAASFSVATIGLTYLLGRRVYGKPVGLIASVLMAVSVIDISSSHWVKLDSAVTFFAVLSVILMMQIARGWALRSSVLAGLAVGAAIATRIDTVILVPLLVAAHFPEGGRFGTRVRGLLGRGLAVSLGTACVSYLVISFSLLRFVARTMLGQQSPFAYRGFGSVLQYLGFGDVWLSISHNSVFYMRDVLLASFGFIATIFVGVGLLRCGLSRSREEILLLGFPSLYSLPLLIFNVFSTTYALQLVPFLMVLAGGGIVTVGRWLGRETSWRLVAVFTLLAVAVPAYHSVGYAAYLASNVDTRTRAQRWIYTHIPFGERIAVQKHQELPAFLPALDEKREEGEAKLAITRARGLGSGLAFEARLRHYPTAETYSIVNLSVETHWGPDGSQLENNYDFDRLLTEGVRYVITSGRNNPLEINEDRNPCGILVAPWFQNVQALGHYAHFMQRLGANGRLVAEFVPRNPGITRLTCSPVDPTIRIYRLP